MIEGKNLAAMDKGGTSDPYCIITSSFNKQRFKSKIVKKTLNPKWDQEFKLCVDNPSSSFVSLLQSTTDVMPLKFPEVATPFDVSRDALM